MNLDDRLSLGADGEVQLVFLSDLHKERLKAGREVTIDSRGCDPADAVRQRDDKVLMTFVHLPKGTFYMGWGGAPRREDVLARFFRGKVRNLRLLALSLAAALRYPARRVPPG